MDSQLNLIGVDGFLIKKEEVVVNNSAELAKAIDAIKRAIANARGKSILVEVYEYTSS